MTGGAGPYRKGAAHEREVAAYLRERGALVVRSPQSGQAMDLTVLWPKIDMPGNPLPWVVGQRDWLVQCKLGGYMRPAEREELIELAKTYGCRPVLVGRKPFVFTDLVSGGQIAPPDSNDAPAAPRSEVSA